MNDSPQAIEFDLGVGGHAARQFSFEQIRRLQSQLRQFPDDICRKQSMAAVKKAARWGLFALRTNVARLGHKTGNLMRATAVKTKWYKNLRRGLPVAVAVIGYRRSGTGDSKKTQGAIRIGNDRAFHSHLVEFGTKRRLPGKTRTVGRIRFSVNGRARTRVIRQKETVDPNRWFVMSSWKTSGPFRSGNGGTSPPYPAAFLAKIDPQKGLGAMPAFHPVEHAYKGSATMMAQSLEDHMRKALAKATADLAKRAA